MQGSKKIILLIVVIVLLGSLGLMTYMLSNGSSLLGFSLRASNAQDEVDPFLVDLKISPSVPATQLSPTVSTQITPTGQSSNLLAYNSTSPTPVPQSGSGTPVPSVSVTVIPGKGGLIASPTVTSTQTPTLTPTEFIEITGEGISPTIVTQLPVSGITDNVNKILFGGGVLILLAFLL